MASHTNEVEPYPALSSNEETSEPLLSGSSADFSARKTTPRDGENNDLVLILKFL